MSTRPVFIVDYGAGNVGSLINLFDYLRAPVFFASNPADVPDDARLVLPGVGHFGRASESLFRSGFANFVIERAMTGTPILGICLGMQLLFDFGHEGDAPGLGLISGRVVAFEKQKFAHRLPLPNVGWRYVHAINSRGEGFLTNMQYRPKFYFVHNYHAECDNEQDTTLVSEYGYRFTCGAGRANIDGFQFHPEKSHHFGMTLLSNWLRLTNGY